MGRRAASSPAAAYLILALPPGSTHTSPKSTQPGSVCAPDGWGPGECAVGGIVTNGRPEGLDQGGLGGSPGGVNADAREGYAGKDLTFACHQVVKRAALRRCPVCLECDTNRKGKGSDRQRASSDPEALQVQPGRTTPDMWSGKARGVGAGWGGRSPSRDVIQPKV